MSDENNIIIKKDRKIKKERIKGTERTERTEKKGTERTERTEKKGTERTEKKGTERKGTERTERTERTKTKNKKEKKEKTKTKDKKGTERKGTERTEGTEKKGTEGTEGTERKGTEETERTERKDVLKINIKCELDPVKRIIAIGDLHGDYKAAIISLQKANLIDKKKKWIGGDTVVIQLGDQVDRGGRLNGNNDDSLIDEDSEFKIMNLFDRLHKDAKKVGGSVYSLIGNHELMNVLGDFTYTSALGIKHFGNEKKRYDQFKSGGKIAIKMSKTRVVIIKIGDWIFVHGGITPKIAKKYKIPYINDLMNKYLLGDEKLVKEKSFRELFLNNGSLLWTRRYSDENPDCKSLSETLSLMSAKKMVVGHTPQNDINCKCKNNIWRVDTGMSQAFGKRNGKERVQVLEIINNGEKVNIL